MKTKRLVIYGLLIAMHVVLCFLTIDLGNQHITLSGFPIIIAGALYGPLGGLEVGLLGSFVNQMISYGISVTTILWILPAGLRGLMVGWYAKKHDYQLTGKKLTFILILSAFCVTTLNTVVMYLDAKIYGYYTFAYVFGSLVSRYLTAIVVNIVYVLLTEPILARIKPIKDREGW